jgi:hypothetical protein
MQYGDPAAERLNNGRSMAELMRGGVKGLRGVIVAPSTPGGVPINFDPHARGSIQINIEPDGPNSQAVTLDQMTSSRVAQAMAVAKSQVVGNDINSIRERAAVAFEELAKLAKSGVERVPVKKAVVVVKPPPVPPAVVEEEVVLAELAAESKALEAVNSAGWSAAVPVEKIDRGYSPMAAFGLKKSPMPITTSHQPVITKTAHIGPPQKLTYFEKEGIGTVPAFFHDVIVAVGRAEPDSPEENGFIVLVYDLRFDQNAARWFPPSNDPYQRPWAVKISDDTRLYLVHTTGFQYVYDNREYCVLMVERAVRAQYAEE